MPHLYHLHGRLDQRKPPPHGLRLLVQCLDAATEAEARAWLARVFGAAKAAAAVLTAGTVRPDWDGGPWTERTKGYRAYLPLGWTAPGEGEPRCD